MTKQRYKIGDEFAATLAIVQIDDFVDEDGTHQYLIRIKELDDDLWVNEETLDMAYCPTYKESVRLARIAELEAEIKQLKGKGRK